MNKPPIGSTLRNDGHWSTQGLVGCWLFNEGGGKTAYDLSGVCAAGTLSSAAKLDSNLKTNNGYALIPCKLDMSRPCTIVTRFSWPSATLNFLFDTTVGSRSCFYAESTTAYQLIIGGYGIDTTGLNNLLPSGKTHVLAISFDISSGVLDTEKFYLNGKLISTVNTGATHNNPPTQLVLGSRSAFDYTSLTSIDYMMFYNRALNANEIKALHENPYQMVQSPQQFFPKSRLIDPTKNAWRWT